VSLFVMMEHFRRVGTALPPLFFARPSVTTNRAPCESCERVATQPLRLVRLWLLALVELVYLH